MQKISVVLALLLCSSSFGYDSRGSLANLGQKSLTLALIMCASLELASAAVQKPQIQVTDAWNYWTTNTQSILSILGTLTMSVNFISAYYYYRKSQSRMAQLLRNRIRHFTSKTSPPEARRAEDTASDDHSEDAD